MNLSPVSIRKCDKSPFLIPRPGTAYPKQPLSPLKDTRSCICVGQEHGIRSIGFALSHEPNCFGRQQNLQGNCGSVWHETNVFAAFITVLEHHILCKTPHTIKNLMENPAEIGIHKIAKLWVHLTVGLNILHNRRVSSRSPSHRESTSIVNLELRASVHVCGLLLSNHCQQTTEVIWCS